MLPDHLSKASAQGLVPGEAVAQFELGSMSNFVYLIIDWEKKVAALIDPQKDITTPLQALENHGISLIACLLTHTHHDHIAGVPALLEKFPELSIYLHEKDRHRLKKIPSHSHFQLLEDAQSFFIGNIEIQALHTPGHSSGEICYRLKTTPSYLFTGDTLFIRDCGRTDLETGNDEEMFQSLQKIKKLPGDAVILPGHHYQKECASLLSIELAQSPPLRCASVSELKNLP